MAQDERPPSFADFDARLDKLRKDTGLEPAESQSNDRRGVGSSGPARVGIELAVGVIGGVLFGYMLDKWFDTKPVFLFVFFLLGAAAGMLNAYRFMRRMGEEAERDDDRRV